MTRCLMTLALLTASFPLNAMAQRAIPDDNLAYPVLITLTDCASNVGQVKATGFFLNTESDTYLVTARHVLFNEAERLQPGQPRSLLCKKAELLSHSKNPKEKEQNRLELDLPALSAAGAIKAHDTHDVAIVQVGSTLKTAGTADKSGNVSATPGILVTRAGVQPTNVAPSGLLGVGVETVKRLADVLAANDIYVLGYPSSIGVQQMPQIDYTVPLVRKGIVAGINDSNKTIVLDCLIFQGNSGGS